MHDQALYLESPHDQRAVFVLPWQGPTLLGMTERPFDGVRACLISASQPRCGRDVADA